ncbi:hypothetical protein ACHAPU_010978 [Fusarium lateritium]
MDSYRTMIGDISDLSTLKGIPPMESVFGALVPGPGRQPSSYPLEAPPTPVYGSSALPTLGREHAQQSSEDLRNFLNDFRTEFKETASTFAALPEAIKKMSADIHRLEDTLLKERQERKVSEDTMRKAMEDMRADRQIERNEFYNTIRSLQASSNDLPLEADVEPSTEASAPSRELSPTLST